MRRIPAVLLLTLAGCASQAGVQTLPEATATTSLSPAGSGALGAEARGWLADLDQALARWNAGDRSDYSYVYLRKCECLLPEPQGPNTVFVADGEVTKVEHFGSREAVDGFTAEELFERIETAIRDDLPVAVTYDPHTGFPASMDLEVGATPGTDPLILTLELFLSYSDLRSELAEAREVWFLGEGANYDLSYRATPDLVVRSQVRGGMAVERPIETAEISDGLPLTIADLFDQVEAAIDKRPATMSVTYDSRLGFPNRVDVDFDPSVRDEVRIFDVAVLQQPE